MLELTDEPSGSGTPWAPISIETAKSTQRRRQVPSVGVQNYRAVIWPLHVRFTGEALKPLLPRPHSIPSKSEPLGPDPDVSIFLTDHVAWCATQFEYQYSRVPPLISHQNKESLSPDVRKSPEREKKWGAQGEHGDWQNQQAHAAMRLPGPLMCRHCCVSNGCWDGPSHLWVKSHTDEVSSDWEKSMGWTLSRPLA